MDFKLKFSTMNSTKTDVQNVFNLYFWRNNQIMESKVSNQSLVYSSILNEHQKLCFIRSIYRPSVLSSMKNLHANLNWKSSVARFYSSIENMCHKLDISVWKIPWQIIKCNKIFIKIQINRKYTFYRSNFIENSKKLTTWMKLFVGLICKFYFIMSKTPTFLFNWNIFCGDILFSLIQIIRNYNYSEI